MATGLPASGGNGTIRFMEEGRPVEGGHEDECDILTVNSSYFSALKIPLEAGRVFTPHDVISTPWIAVVNRTFAKTFFPNENAVGKRIRFTYNAKEPFREIVGIVGDTAQDDLAAVPPAAIYVANDQGSSTFLSYVVRTAGDPAGMIGAARAVLREMDPKLPMIQPLTMQEIADQSPSVFLRRYPSYLIAGFAGLALVLAMVGLYGLISYGVAQRTREIGIRVTLGAQQRDVLQLVLRQGFTAVLAGTVLGVIAGLALTRLLGSILYGVQPGDWITFSSVSLLLLIVAMGASLLPARRAMKVDPAVALRGE